MHLYVRMKDGLGSLFVVIVFVACSYCRYCNAFHYFLHYMNFKRSTIEKTWKETVIS